MEARLYIEGKKDFFLKLEGASPDESRCFYALEADVPDVVEEIAWSQLKKLGKELKKFLESCGFTVYKLSVDIANKMYILLDVEADRLSSVEKREGPPVENYTHSLRFVEKYNNYFVEKDRLYVLRPRKFTDVKEAIRFFFKHSQLPSHMPKNWVFCDPPEDVFKKYEVGLI
jgi:tRNA nucleotidyltransferase (CCA-adding enzyme)